MIRKSVWSVAAVAVLAACGGGDEAEAGADATATDNTAVATDAAAVTATDAPPAAPAAGAVTDPQIAAIVVAANNADIEGGKLAQTKATDPKVKEFAQRMVTDHGGVNKAATDLVTRLGVTPEENPASQQQTQAGEAARQKLQGLSGAEFDRAYIANEVTYHQGLLDAINSTLIPSAQNPELKALLEQTRPAVEAHLKHAQELQTSLGQG